MSSIQNDVLEKQLRWRYAVKQFDPHKKVAEADLITLLRSLVLAPSSFGLQPWKFIVVENPELRAELVKASWGQKQIQDASHLIVIAGLKRVDVECVDRYIASMAMHHKTEPHALKHYRDIIVQFIQNPAFDTGAWAAKQAYIALGFLMESAALLHIDTCPMEGINSAEYDRILNVDPAYATLCGCPIGYRSADDKYADFAKVRYDHGELIEYR